MDCDDDDVSRHSLQLASECRNRSSSVLRPYDFPKFDFDESLQGHLRFDSLVETEVFLGIQSQEDNRWIEEYSQGSNGMEFNSNPADSHAISRRDNVWSEATSSESVEMLLSSVGQEDMLPSASTTPGTNACDDQGAIIRHVEFRIDQDVRNSDTIEPREKVLSDNSTQDRCMAEELPRAVGPSLTAENIGSSCENIQSLAQDTVCATSGVSENAEYSHHSVSADKNIEESSTFGSFQFSMLSSTKATLQTDANVSHETCNEGGRGRNVSILTGLKDNVNLEGKTGEISVNVSDMGNTPCLAPESVVEESINATETIIECPQISDSKSTLCEKEDQLISRVEDEKHSSMRISAQTDDGQAKSFAASSDMEDPLDGCQGGSSVGDSSKHSADLSCIDRHCRSPDQKGDSFMQMIPIQDDRMLEGMQTSQFQRTLTETPSLVLEDNKVPAESGDLINNNTDISKSNDTNLSTFDAGNKRTGKVEGCGNVSTFTHKELGAHLPGHVAGDSREMCEDNTAHPRAGFFETEQVVCGSRQPDGKPSVFTGIMESANVETPTNDLGTQFMGEDEVVKDNNSLPKTQNLPSGRIKADVLVPHAESNAIAAVAGWSENIPSKSSVIGSSAADNNTKEVAVRESSGAHFRTVADNVSEMKDGNNIKSPLSEVAAKSLQSVENCNEMSSSRFPSTELTNPLHLDDSKVSLGCGKSILKGSAADIGGGGNHESSLVKFCGDQESTPVAEIDKASCGSPTIICSSEPSRMEADDQNEFRGAEVVDKSVKDNQVTSEDIKGKSLLGDDSSFTFKVDAMPDTTREPGKSWALFHDADICNSPVVAKESIPSVKGKTERLPSPKTPRQGTQMTNVEALQGTSKETSQRKGRRASAKGATKESDKKVSQVKGTSQEISAGTVDKGVDVPPTLNLPDVNASALSKSTSMPPSYRQPFTDLQQVQLRAQIFVYGSLIQGSTPDEACMVSAFGPLDAGRSTWDPIWRAAIERVRNQKSRSSATETPLHLQSGATPSDLAVKKSVHPSKFLAASPVNKVSKKDTPATIASPIIPLSSPLWSISTSSRDSLRTSTMQKGPVMDFQQPFTPLHSCQTPPIRSFVGHTPWPNQTSFSASWLASPQTATFNSNVCFQPATMTETVKLIPVNDNPLSLASGVKHMTSSSIVHTMGPNPMYKGLPPPPDPKKISPEQQSVSIKPRKRKKISGSDPVHSTLVAEAQTTSVAIHGQSSPPAPDATLATSVSSASTLYSIDPPQMHESDKVKSVPCSEETLKNIVNAKTEAENASKLAANAVTHCEEFWGKLAKEKKSGLALEMEKKMISAAAAISAAASVAKAAASAANVAFNAALQAKLVADEAFLSGKPGVVPSSSTSSTYVHDRGNATPEAILKGKKSSDKTNSIPVAGMQQVETTSAASKQAENWDAIVKAAELAASAVSQAGKIVAMGEPSPLVDIIEAGPDGYWKLPQTLTDQAGRSRNEKTKHLGATDVKESDGVHAKVPSEDSITKGGTSKRGPGKTRQSGKLKDSVYTQISFADGSMRLMETDEKDSISERDAEMTTGVASEPDIAQRTDMENEVESAGESIKEGSAVEVFKCGDSLKSAWYSANVLKLEDRKAYVCYSDLSSKEVSGSVNLCEWVCVEGEGKKAPVIRAAHTLSSFQYQGTRKRRRAASGDYAWCVGDKVDVWIDDCWWEGVVTEKNEKDETTLKVHFPAQGETSIVRAWNLRSSRSWIDGRWVECSKKALNSSDQGDAPKEKRQKMGSPAIATQAKDKLYNGGELLSGNRDELSFLPLLTSDRTFDVGKSTKPESKGVARKPLRRGQQKEGSRLIFGVPKPTGKKQKFMEVSKQFPPRKGDQSNNAPDQVKVAKYSMSQGTGSRGWKLPSRNDPKEKPTFEPKPRVPSMRKSHRTLPQRGHHDSRSGHDMDSGSNHDTDPENSVGHDDNSSEKMTDPDFSVTDELAEVPLSSLISQSLSAGSKKTLSNSRPEKPSSNSRSERLNRGKLELPGGKLTKIDEDKADSGTFVREENEPRRSNRRFQPTHRLLEGLQSSMVLPRMASVSHDKGQRNLRRNVLTRGK